MTTGLAARSTPYREPTPGARTCGYCGGKRSTQTRNDTPYYCKDCTPLARQLGWLPAIPTYDCTRCGKTFTGQHRDICGQCTWNTRHKRKGSK